MSEVLYVCPSCKARNEEHLSYCKNCGAWLLSSAYPAKRATRGGKQNRTSWIVVSMVVILAILAGLYFWDNPAEFESMDVGDVTISQLVVKRPFLRAPEAAADITATVDIHNPLSIRTIYYDSARKRLGIAEAVLISGLSRGQTTTVELEFSGRPNLGSMAEVRVEIKELSPFELLEKAADRLNDIDLSSP